MKRAFLVVFCVVTEHRGQVDSANTSQVLELDGLPSSAAVWERIIKQYEQALARRTTARNAVSVVSIQELPLEVQA